MSATGQRTNGNRGASGFTLIELILVMTILSIAVAIAAPSMSGFFKGRTQESEARQLLSLIRYGQSRAVSEGIPTMLWIDTRNRMYGLEQDPTWVEDDPKAVEFELDEKLAIDTTGGLVTKLRGKSLPAIVFLPDKSFGNASPTEIGIELGKDSTIWIVQSRNGLTYEIENENTKVRNAFR